MNSYMNMQAKNMIQMLETFKIGMKYAAQKDDGKIDTAEEKKLNKINKAVDNLIKELK